GPRQAGFPPNRSVWGRGPAPAGGTATFDTCGSAFDTVLAVYADAASLGGLAPVASNDDSCGLQSRVTFTATAGASYAVAVDGYGGATGAIALRWALTAPAAAPADDPPAGATAPGAAPGAPAPPNAAPPAAPPQPRGA